MAIREIAQMGNPILYRRAVEVADPKAPEIARLAHDMMDTLMHVGGSGIAAPQVYECLRLVVYRISPRLVDNADNSPNPWVVLVNPVLEPLGCRSGGCLVGTPRVGTRQRGTWPTAWRGST